MALTSQKSWQKLESSPYNLTKTRSSREGSRTFDESSTLKDGTRRRRMQHEALKSEPLDPRRVIECGLYLGVKLDDEEHALLSVAREALNAPVSKHWELRLDNKGVKYYYNCRTGLRARFHPAEKEFQKVVATLRGRDFHTTHKARTWMKFVSGPDGGDAFYHDFLTGKQEASLPSGSEELHGVPDELLPAYDVDVSDKTQKEIVDDVKVLSFKSWWYEDKEEATLGNGSSAGGGLKKRYVTLEYDLRSKNFRVILEENVAIDLKDMQTKQKTPMECWDLYIGAMLHVLGKNTTLQQGTLETILWLDFHAAQLLRVKADLERTLQKYQTTSINAALSFTLRNKPGCCNLRQLMYQIEQLKSELSKYRPQLAKTFVPASPVAAGVAEG